MLTVRTYLDKSSISGIGLFAGEFLRQGKQVYIYDPRFTIIVDEDEVILMAPAAQESFLKYSYKGTGDFRLNSAFYYNIDDARYINHSDDPNLLWVPKFNIYLAKENIEKGTELTCDYSVFCEKGDLSFNF